MKPDLLVIDADDTLWESARFFQRAEEDFLSLVVSLGQDRETVRREIHDRDVLRLSVTGYGARPYMDTLRTILQELGLSGTGWVDRSFSDIETNLLTHPVLIQEGVIETLRQLYDMHIPTVVYTAGEPGHQEDKFSRSGLSGYVNALQIVPVKTAATLASLLREYDAPPDRTILVGDSPRSDINPALENGVNAVHVRRSVTWQAEHEDFIHPERVTVIDSFRDLLRIVEEPELFFVGTADRWS
jgi:putative hydrolase of the HAD superfamily